MPLALTLRSEVAPQRCFLSYAAAKIIRLPETCNRDFPIFVLQRVKITFSAATIVIRPAGCITFQYPTLKIIETFLYLCRQYG